MIERLGVRKGSIHICISGWHTGDVGILSSLIITKGEVDILGCGGLGAGVGCLCQSWGGAPVPMGVQPDCGFCPERFGPGRQSSICISHPLPAVFLMQALPFNANVTQLPTFTLVGLQH